MLKSIVFTPMVGSAVTLHDSTGGNYQVTRAEGIVGPPGTRDVEKVAPGRDGNLNDTRFLDGRSILLEGEVFGSSTSDVLSKWDTMAAAFQTTLWGRGTLTVTRDDNTARQCEVVLTGNATPSLEGGTNLLQYQINFKAPDPRWYGLTVKTSTATISQTGNSPSSIPAINNVINAGNAPTSPTLTWTSVAPNLRFFFAQFTVPTAYSSLPSSGTGVILLDGGNSVSYLSVNQFVNCMTRTTNTTATINATTQWPVLYPGTTSWAWAQKSAGSTATSTCVLSWRDAWI